MAKNIFREMLKPQANLSRNGFDRSYLHNFSSKIGELLPVMAVETVPGSHYEINVSDLMRTIPMHSASFIRASQHFEFYFVPYKLLWRRWDDFFTTRSMPISTQQSMAVPQAAPCASLGNILEQIRDAHSINNVNYGDIGEYIGAGCDKIANLLGYVGNKAFDAEDDLPDFLYEMKPNLFRAAAYQKICFDFYRQPFYDLPYEGIQYTVNLDDADVSTGLVSNTFASEGSNYPRLAKLFQLHYRQWKKDLFTGVLPDTQFGAVSVVSTGGSSTVTKNIELAVDGLINASSFPVVGDGLSVSRDLDNHVPSGQAVVVNSQSGALMDDDGNYIKIGNNVSNAGANILAQANIVDDTVGGTASGNVTFNLPSGTFSVLSLVRAQAIQKWREITLRSGFRASDQYKGHFGVEPIFTEKDKCVFIDSVSSPLQVNTVTNTSAPQVEGAAALGDLAANGTSVVRSDKTIKFDSKDYGILMCIQSVLPEATYDHFGLDLMNQKILKDDFFVPEFENIGMQSVPMLSFRCGSSNVINGFAARYYEYKVGLDIQSAEFATEQRIEDYSLIPAGAFAEWSPAREIQLDWDKSGIVYPRLFARDLYVSPSYFRNIFTKLPYKVGESDPAGNVIRQTIGDSKYDSFIHQCYFDIKCVQPMSVLGMPSY